MEDNGFYKQLGAVMREEREKARVTQPEMARKLGVTKQLISFWESGRRTVSARHLVMYCHALGLTVDSVLARVEV